MTIKSVTNTLAMMFIKSTSKLWSDKCYLKMLYRLEMGHGLDLTNPKTYSEKCQWLKLYYRRNVFTTMVDKYAVKQYIANLIGEEYVVPCYGVWDNFDQIDFENLPETFCLKCVSDSGGYVTCKDKATFDKTAAKKKLEIHQKNEYFWNAREWPYKNVKPRILAEEYIPSLGKKDSVEYKLSCFNGEVKFITVCGGIPHSANNLRTNDHYTKDWKQLKWTATYESSGKTIEKPDFMDKIVALSEKLSTGIPHVRVDWYVVDDHIYFGEFTFYTWAGFPKFQPKEWDEILGGWIELPEKDVE